LKQFQNHIFDFWEITFTSPEVYYNSDDFKEEDRPYYHQTTHLIHVADSI